MAQAIDLNADVGEATDADGIDVERTLLTLVTSAHVACGGHAGDEHTMRDTVAAALSAGARIGAHPSYPDRAGFGRRPMSITAGELEASVLDQLQSLRRVCEELGARLVSVKPHGALYGEVGAGGDALSAVRRAVEASGIGDVALVLAAGAPAVALCRDNGQRVLAEGFCDRAYAADGTLVDRRVEGAVLHDPALAAAQAIRLAQGGTVDTLCIHGDSPGASDLARAVRHALEEAAVSVAAVDGT
jgi:UPF0271 protein